MYLLSEKVSNQIFSSVIDFRKSYLPDVIMYIRHNLKLYPIFIVFKIFFNLINFYIPIYIFRRMTF